VKSKEEEMNNIDLRTFNLYVKEILEMTKETESIKDSEVKMLHFSKICGILYSLMQESQLLMTDLQKLIAEVTMGSSDSMNKLAELLIKPKTSLKKGN
jgi:LytS/YehU family sensor histidine kinase